MAEQHSFRTMYHLVIRSLAPSIDQLWYCIYPNWLENFCGDLYDKYKLRMLDFLFVC